MEKFREERAWLAGELETDCAYAGVSDPGKLFHGRALMADVGDVVREL